MNKLSKRQELFHNRVLNLGRVHARIEQQLIENLIGVEETNAHKALGKPSLFAYAMTYLDLTKPMTYGLITVARKSREVPALRKALTEKLTVAKATRFAAHINNQNADELIEFAMNHTFDEIDYEVARRNPKAKKPDKIKVIAEDQFEITVTVNQQTLNELKRIQSLLAQRQKPATLSDAVAASPPYYLKKEDPVKKAERHANRPKSQEKELCVHRVTIKKPTAAQKHAVNNRTKGRCTFKDEKGHRCNSDRWVDIHHIKPRSEGGTNDPENLTTLCSFHHDLVHQLSLPIEGQITWLR